MKSTRSLVDFIDDKAFLEEGCSQQSVGSSLSGWRLCSNDCPHPLSLNGLPGNFFQCLCVCTGRRIMGTGGSPEMAAIYTNRRASGKFLASHMSAPRMFVIYWINDPWRICFEWGDAGPEQVEIVDYHEGIRTWHAI